MPPSGINVPTHVALKAVSAAARAAVIEMKTQIGWDMGFLGLARHLATGRAADPAEIAAWTGSQECREFMALSSDGWRDASLAAGTDPEDAVAAAAKVIAAYTGAPG